MYHGVILGIFMPWAWSLVSIPILLVFTPLFIWASDKRRFWLTMLLGGLSAAYSTALIVLWTYFVFYRFTMDINGTWIPWLVWGYSVTLGPLAWMAKKEPADAFGTNLGLLLSAVSYAVLVIMWLTVGVYVWVLVALAIVSLSFQLIITYRSTRTDFLFNNAEDPFYDDELGF